MKRISLVPILLYMLLILSGCEFKSGDNLLQAPQPSKTYEALQKQLDAIAEDDMAPVSPQSGQSRTTVQLVDLDQDGEDEVIAFFGETKKPDQFHVYIFEKKDDSYVMRGDITGTGVHIASVAYPTLTPTGERGIALSWKMGGDNPSSRLTVCSFSGGKVKTLLETTYHSMITAKLDDSGADNLILFTADASGRRIAQMYGYAGGSLALRGETSLAPEVQTIVSLKTGGLRGERTAVFAEGKPELGAGLMTDILIYDDKGFRNLALEGENMSDQGTYRPVSVPATDVNADQLIEVPRAVPMQGTSSADTTYMLDWYAYSTEHKPERVTTTYQNVSENWQFVLSDIWREQVTVSKGTSEGMATTTFSEYRAAGKPVPLLTIYRLTGDMRSFYAARDHMIFLGQTQTEIFTATIPESAAESTIALDQETIKQQFSVITQSWNN